MFKGLQRVFPFALKSKDPPTALLWLTFVGSLNLAEYAVYLLIKVKSKVYLCVMTSKVSLFWERLLVSRYLERLLQSICGKWADDHTESRKSICFGKRQWCPYISERLLESICVRLAEMVSIWAKSRWVSLLIVAKGVSFFALCLLTDDPKKVRVSVWAKKNDEFPCWLWQRVWVFLLSTCWPMTRKGKGVRISWKGFCRLFVGDEPK